MAYYDKQKVLDIALAEVDYCEKETYDQQDDKTANAGDKNYTKYQRDLAKINYFNSSKKGVAWCAVFAAWPFVQAFGKDAALKLLCQPKSNNAGAGCNSFMNYFKAKGQFHDKPEVGDLIFFESSTKPGESSHVGLVYKTSLLNVYTVEGNTSDGKAIVENGGEVCEKKYAKSNKRILGYGRPDWGDPNEAEPEDVPTEDEAPVIDTPVEYIGTAIVNAPSGRVNFRQKPNKNAAGVVGMYKVKNGEEVKVRTKDDTWAAVDYGKYHGYIMLEFLVFETEVEESPTPNIQTVYYIVEKGDTLWGISKKFYFTGTSYKKIMEANGLKKSVIRPGMRLKIPDVESDG